jgi:hypothetical protein
MTWERIHHPRCCRTWFGWLAGKSHLWEGGGVRRRRGVSHQGMRHTAGRRSLLCLAAACRHQIKIVSTHSIHPESRGRFAGQRCSRCRTCKREHEGCVNWLMLVVSAPTPQIESPASALIVAHQMILIVDLSFRITPPSSGVGWCGMEGEERKSFRVEDQKGLSCFLLLQSRRTVLLDCARRLTCDAVVVVSSCEGLKITACRRVTRNGKPVHKVCGGVDGGGWRMG